MYGRRCFHPLISDFPMFCGLPSADPANFPIARKIAEQIICLLISPGLTGEDVQRVIAAIKKSGVAS